MAEAIAEAGTGQSGIGSNACLVASIFTVAEAKLASILTPFAPGLATSWDAAPGVRPVWESIILARKPLCGTVAENVLRYGTGAINVEACRVGTEPDDPNRRKSTGENGGAKSIFGVGNAKRPATLQQGRWPANLILTYPEDQYMLRDDVTPDQLHKLAEWINENAKR